MTWQFSSALIIIAAPILIGGYDLVAFLVAGNKATISRISLETANSYPGYQWAICFLFGLLCAHLFAPSPTKTPFPGWLSLTLFVGVPVLVVFGTLILGVKQQAPLLLKDAQEVTRDYPLVTVMVSMILGAAVGASFLPQSSTPPADGVTPILQQGEQNAH